MSRIIDLGQFSTLGLPGSRGLVKVFDIVAVVDVSHSDESSEFITAPALNILYKHWIIPAVAPRIVSRGLLPFVQSFSVT